MDRDSAKLLRAARERILDLEKRLAAVTRERDELKAQQQPPAAPPPPPPPPPLQSPSPQSTGSGPRKKKQPRRETYAPNAPPPPQPKPVDADPGPEPGTRFVDEGKLWVVYRREGRRMVTKVVGTAKLRKVYKELDVVYYYAADAPRPSEENYLSECEYSGIGEVRDWIARTPPHFAAQPAPTAAAAAPAAHSRDAAAAAAAAARPRPAAKAPAAPAAKERPRPARRPAAQKAPAAAAAPSAPPPLRPCNGTVEATSASGICAVKWADGTTSDLLVADARRLGLAV